MSSKRNAPGLFHEKQFIFCKDIEVLQLIGNSN